MTEKAEAPAPGTPEYDAAMAAKFDERTGQGTENKPEATPAPARPDNIPEEYWDAEKGEVKMEALLEAAKAAKQEPEKKTDEVPADEADKALEGTGLNVDEFRAEFAEKGALSEESYARLAKAGLDKELVDGYIAGQAALAATERAEAFSVVGGEEQYNQMVAWAASNMTQAEKIAYNKAVEGGSSADRVLAIEGLRAKYERENGRMPQLLGGKATSGDAAGFASRAEQSAAINKKDSRGRRLYDIDPAYRSEVQGRIARSSY